MNKKLGSFYIFAHSVEPNGISGGETILIETFKRIGKYFKSVYVYTWMPGKMIYEQYGLKNVTYKLSKLPVLSNFYLSFIMRVLYGLWLGFSLKIPNSKKTYIYYSSDFWPDALPVILLRFRFPKITFISCFYLAAPNPFFGFDEQKKNFHIPTINGIFFYLMQKPVYWFANRFADLVLVTSEPDVERFQRLKKLNKFFIVKGGVNVSNINKFKKFYKNGKKKYDGVFMGRFHSQKGVLELIDIWKHVVQKKKNAQLIMIGDGSLMPRTREKIQEFGLENNITLTGYLFNKDERYKIFTQSKIALHPALYDSGGMAVAEAMAFGLPAVSFDLVALRSYYPQGMLKAPQGDEKKFAAYIIQLLKDKKLYTKTKTAGLALIKNEWNWDEKAKQIAQKIQAL